MEKEDEERLYAPEPIFRELECERAICGLA
jgi:hypothetical protein